MPFDVTERMPEETSIDSDDRERELGRLKAINLENEQRIATLEARLQEERAEASIWMKRAREHRLAAEAAEETVKKLRAQYEGVSLGQTLFAAGSRADAPGKVQDIPNRSVKKIYQTVEAGTPQASHAPENTRIELETSSRGRAALKSRGCQRGRGSNPQDPVIQVTNTRPRVPSTPGFKPIGAIKASSYHALLAEHQVELLLETLITKPDKFDEISDQVVAWANTSERERDGRTMIAVIRAIFTTLSTGDTPRSEVYGRLCRKLMDGVSPKVQDDELVDADGKPVSGSQLFRKHFINRCQDNFEKSIDSKSEGEGTPSDSEEVQVSLPILCGFLGELFRQRMLTEHIMHECLKVVLRNIEDPGEEQLEGLCSLLNSIGAKLDVPRARARMDLFFQCIETLSTNPLVEPRMQAKLKEIIQLRERKWDGKT
ncbi:hypothetical protein D9611_006321 [Ephemerocybe angulata]|uniref:MIF4G domain-containing protein n=1 Tax=Ephemerocybe angulata TaxID=980116 RepID=A0A8H5C6G0_9AGAR|nr:hypothetical protein D9611_006321 [Tulosesus angulatus]